MFACQAGNSGDGRGSVARANSATKRRKKEGNEVLGIFDVRLKPQKKKNVGDREDHGTHVAEVRRCQGRFVRLDNGLCQE
ncbi:hypothetical protein Q5P01_022663 [Channa striata]|uniref:Uncharacterized protein n=1 Tax=Channa striata TaxID=64152 RepID=A0AA88LRF0_CHASR|nr:hypothetical protein Q5P01_022663 [Channa striata]